MKAHYKIIVSLLVLTTLLLVIFTVISASDLSMIIGTGGLEWALRPAVEKFTEETGITVEMYNLAYAARREKMLLDFSTHAGRYDVVPIDGGIWMAEMHPFLEPLDKYIERDNYDMDDFIPSLVKEMSIPYPEGDIYALPTRFGAWITHYRKDLFEEAGLEAPTNITNFLEAAKSLTKDLNGDGVIDQYGTALAGLQGNFLVAQWVPFLWNFGAELWNEDYTELMANSERGIEATQYMVDLYLKYKVAPPGCIEYEHQGVIVALQQGLAASAITYSPYGLLIDNPEKSRTAGKWAWAPPPYAEKYGLTEGKTLISGWGHAINKDSKNKELAWKLIKFLGSKKYKN